MLGAGAVEAGAVSVSIAPGNVNVLGPSGLMTLRPFGWRGLPVLPVVAHWPGLVGRWWDLEAAGWRRGEVGVELIDEEGDSLTGLANCTLGLDFSVTCVEPPVGEEVLSDCMGVSGSFLEGDEPLPVCPAPRHGRVL